MGAHYDRKPQAIVRQDAHGSWYFMLRSVTGTTVYEGTHYGALNGKLRAMADRDLICGIAARAAYVTED